MLDKNSEKILKLFISKDEDLTLTSIAFSLNNSDLDSIEKSLDILIEANCIKLSPKSSVTCNFYSLTNKGRHFFKTKSNDNFYKYWYPVITALISFVLSLIVNLITK